MAPLPLSLRLPKAGRNLRKTNVVMIIVVIAIVLVIVRVISVSTAIAEVIDIVANT